MTSEVIKNLPAGIGTDYLVCEQLFGWQWNDAHNEFGPPGDWSKSETVWMSADGVYFPGSMPHPSTRILDAWEVVKELHERYGCDVSAELRRDIHAAKTVGICRLQYGKLKYDNPDLLIYVAAETVPLAICRAALLAEASKLSPGDQ